MQRIKEVIVVEGRYDKNTLSQIVDAEILETAGFGIMKDKKQLALLRRVAEKRGLIIFTDGCAAEPEIHHRLTTKVLWVLNDKQSFYLHKESLNKTGFVTVLA